MSIVLDQTNVDVTLLLSECHWNGGGKYVGEWRGGKAHGEGIETLPDGQIRHNGLWIDDKPVLS
jgi:MORN repeat